LFDVNTLLFINIKNFLLKTGWTVFKKGKQSPICKDWAIKHHSMRETSQLGENYSSNTNLLWISNKLAVKMFSTRGQSAWGKLNYSTLSHQRLNVMRPKNEEFQQWLVGMTDGDGSFSVLRQNDK
jgi:hypothetical protein